MTNDAFPTAGEGPSLVALTRRATLPLIAAVGATGFLVACGSSSSPTVSDTVQPATPGQPAATGPTTDAAPATGAGGAQLATLSQVPAGGGLILSSEKIVITRDDGGSVHAFSAVCTHQGCLVGSVSGGQIICPCHGSRYDASTGEVVQGPSRTALQPVAVAVQNDAILKA